jgi:tetratricopeptide (TPR) repeat protein
MSGQRLSRAATAAADSVRCPAAVLLLAAAALIAPSVRAATCSIGRLAELPVTMVGLTPTVHAKINGSDALFIADSGAFTNILSPAAATAFKLNLKSNPDIPYVIGMGGTAPAYVTEVKSFTIFDITFPRVLFVVAGNDMPAGAAGLIGQNVLRIADVEYDLANGMIRLMRPKDCKDRALAYWAENTGKPFTVIDIEWATARNPNTQGVAYLNGQKIRVMFDTGAAYSTLTLSAARRAGITPASAGVMNGGLWAGAGRGTVKTWIGPFASFKIGDEEIQNTRLRFADADLFADADMLIGVDFFLSHRIYVANSQRKLYFTYNGGPVFNLGAAPAAPQQEGAAPAPDVPPAGTTLPDARLDEPTDAAGYARRGTASTARKDYAHAIADLNRACELAPGEASYFYERGMAHAYNREPDLAQADFDQALKLKPDDPTALIARASLDVSRHVAPELLAADLDAANRALPKDADARISLGELYLSVGQFPAAVLQFSQWIDTHEHREVHMAAALNARCWTRALWGQEIEEALADCNAAVKLRPDSARFLNSRGLVYLRKRDFKNAIADYDASLRLERLPWSLYGRGVARVRTGDAAAGRADIAAATALGKNIAATASRYGITP